MVKKIFLLGDINKKLLLPFLLAVSQILYNVHTTKFPEDESNQILESYSSCIGRIMILIIPYIYKVPINEDNQKIVKRKKCLHYFLLCFIYALNIMLIFTSSLLNKNFDEGKENVKNPNAGGDFFKTGLEMIFLALISICLLKYKYFIHNYIAIGAFIIFGILTDVILGVFSTALKIGYASMLIDFVVTITDSVHFCYQKYMLEKLYYPYWNVVLVPGLVLMVINSTTLIIILICGKNTDINFFKGFYDYFNKIEVGYIVGKFLINVVLNFLLYTFTILTLYQFNPDFVLISLQLSKFVNVLMNNKNGTYYFIIFVVLQFFCLLIYLEIIELNFCELNKNTRRNVQIRGKDDALGNFESESERASIVEITPGYVLNQKGNLVEMEEKDENSKNILFVDTKI